MDSVDGELHHKELSHQDADVRQFYKQFSGEVVVGLEACGYTAWFEEMLEELGHQVWVGDAGEIHRLGRRRHKNDRRDAEMILELVVKGGFPRLHRQSAEARQVLRQLRYRHKLVKMRTMLSNSLQAIALGAGLSLKGRLGTSAGRAKLESVRLPLELADQRKHLFDLYDQLTNKIETVEQWLNNQAKGDQRVARLRTHPGIGLLTSLALVHALEPVHRFSSARKVVAYLGLDPVEESSADKIRFGSISKAGSKVVRFLLIEAGQTAARRDPQLKSFYHRVRKSRKTGRAKVAVGRKLAIRGFIMLRDQIDYAEFLCRGLKSRSDKGGR
jgi:transposase